MNRRNLLRPWRVVRARTKSGRNRLLHHAEVRRGSELPARADRTPIFILGAPRSGTTLFYQLVVEGLDVGYLANAHMVRPGDAANIERRVRPRADRQPSNWTSRHGDTSHSWDPTEAGNYWYRFVDRFPNEITEADATPKRVRAVRAAIREFAEACGGPVVFKNVFNSLRLPLLTAALPEARYIIVDRDTETNARSLLRGRLSNHDTLDRWWSAEPAGADALAGRSPAEQTVWQVEQMKAVARREVGRLDPSFTIEVTYDEVCADPRAALVRIRDWLAQTGVEVQLRPDAVIPETFRRSHGTPLDEATEAQLRAAVAVAEQARVATSSPAAP
ncbi:MAG: hypothetical protein JWM98_2747 [Thermoleophilia bacterium]|nr:hypothetical protein [Thermoleophilia bacterium]